MSQDYEQSQSINLDNALASMQAQTNQENQTTEQPQVVKQSAPVEPVQQQQSAPVRLGESYNPPHAQQEEPPTGIIINNADLNKDEKPLVAPGEINAESHDNIMKYLQEMDESVKGEHEMDAIFKGQKPVDSFGTGELVKKAEESPEKDEDDDVESPEEDEEDDFDAEESAAKRAEKFEQAIVIIDKLNSNNLHFTDEEKQKLERVDSIKVKEIKTLEIKTLRTKKKKKHDVSKVIKRLPSVHDANIVLTASGYTAKLRGASAHELISLMSDSQNALLDAETKWTLLHSKLVETSLGHMNFNDFLRSTAATDYNTLIYGLLMATYPDDDKVPLTCENEKCKETFQHSYSVRSLLRAEEMTEELQEEIKRIVDGSHTEEDAKATHSESAVNRVIRIVLPETQIILDLHVQSAHELINNSIKSLVNNKEDVEKYSQASLFATLIKAAYVADPDSDDPTDPDYFEYTDALDITKLVYALPSNDIIALSKKGEELSGSNFEFGFMNAKCPKCGHIHEYIPFDVESILFYRYQQSMSTSVE